MVASGQEYGAYLKMDLMDIQQKDDDFKYILDKGTFDALCCDQSEETKEKVNKYMSEILRVNDSQNGKYLFVSLL